MDLRIFIILGGILLAVLCFKDYKENVIKPKKYFPYITALGLFIIINLSIYITICLMFLSKIGLNVTFNKGLLQIYPGGVSFEPIHYLIPFAVVFTYFGVGAGTFKVLSIEFRFYSWLIKIFQSLFRNTEFVLKPPGETDNDNDRYQFLANKAMQLQAEANANSGWDRMDKAWKEVKTDSEILMKHIDEFSSINESLSVKPITEANVQEIKQKIKGKISHLWYSVNLMISRFIIHFIFKNIKNTERIEAELTEIGWLQKFKKPEHKSINRLIGISLISGVILGIITAFSNSKDPIINMWCGAISLVIFSLFISKIDKYENTDIGNGIIMGFLGGFFGFFSWIFLDKLQNISKNPDIHFTFKEVINVLKQMPYDRLIIGSLYGVFIVLILYLCRNRGPRKLQIKYCLVSLYGGIVFTTIYIIFRLISFKVIYPEEVFISLFSGITVLLGLAFATNIFDTEDQVVLQDDNNYSTSH